ncbi:MBL fold metallo-hydrolase [Citreimonas salinaria]|uniref:L-ascorbate metabolism protein UlaG, beta-lactamase superfamily n=1 Tax=Citreimonas salinaria TaxID=321339 RepID=A0A1H3KGT6_9RHOB|nr:MBL fold metallo-hydrolase [Citreimonas salinaria]SDY51391.1 L-ascorbate metabolism protein UlaG, beta-lactamase superfamily [Citreimonas salinaria]
MTQTRRTFLATAAAVGTITVLPFAALAAAHEGNTFQTDMGDVTVHPVSHASFVMETPAGTIYVDPVGDVAQYSDFPEPDLILITHEHGDHYNAETLQALMGENTTLITNPAVSDMLPEGLSADTVLANREQTTWQDVTIDAIPAYNMTEGRTDFHPEGRDNGYVLTMGDFRVYVSGDTEDIPEMRALEDIDVAFVSMNLPFTMTAEAAADAVKAFQPTYVYPYHYRGRDGGTQDPQAFAEMVGDASEVKMGDWYAPGELEG